MFIFVFLNNDVNDAFFEILFERFFDSFSTTSNNISVGALIFLYS